MKQYTSCTLMESEIDRVYTLLERTPEFLCGMPKQFFGAQLRQGLIQLWVEPDLDAPTAAMITQINVETDRKVVTVLAFAGRNPDTDGQMWASMRKWAVLNGCSRIRGVCKEAQTRLFRRYGFVKVANLIELELNDE